MAGPPGTIMVILVARIIAVATALPCETTRGTVMDVDARQWSLARQLVVLQVIVVVITIGIEAMVSVPNQLGLSTANSQLLNVLALTEVSITVGVAGSLLIAGRVHRQTLGLGAAEIARQYQHHHAMLHAISEGLLITDNDGTLLLANDEARRLLGMTPDSTSIPANLPGGSQPLRDQVWVAGNRVLLVSRNPVEVDDAPIGLVTTLRDRTELRTTMRELGHVKEMAESLRAQTHESANRLQAVVGLVELGRYEQAVALGTTATSQVQAQTDQLMDQIGEPALIALLLGKTMQAAKRDVEFRLCTEGTVGEQPVSAVEDLLTVVGNLVDNAVDAAATVESGWVELSLTEEPGGVHIHVDDGGPGLPAGHENDIFDLGWSTKPGADPAGRGIGLALVREVVRRRGGKVVASNHDDGGARFEVFLPATQQEDVL